MSWNFGLKWPVHCVMFKGPAETGLCFRFYNTNRLKFKVPVAFGKPRGGGAILRLYVMISLFCQENLFSDAFIIFAKLSPSSNSNLSWGWVGYLISLSSHPPTHHPPRKVWNSNFRVNCIKDKLLYYIRRQQQLAWTLTRPPNIWIKAQKYNFSKI